MKKTMTILALVVALTTSAFATNVPTFIAVQNLNGSQQYIETYTTSTTTDADAIVRDEFDHEGYHYTYANIIKQENLLEDAKVQEEVVVIETASDDLTEILAQLSPTIAYEKDGYMGTLMLDHTTLTTEVAAYTSKSYTVTETKEIGNLSSNDMSYVPSTALKNGMTLPLAAVEWQVQSTALVGDVLVPSQYKAVATYSSNASYSAPTGYITTATYVGDVTCSQIADVTYTVTYLGEEIPEPEVETVVEIPEEIIEEAPEEPETNYYLYIIIGAIILALLAVIGVLAIKNSKQQQLLEAEAADYVETEEEV